MKIKGTVAKSHKNIGELFLVAKSYYQKNLSELKKVEIENRRRLTKRLLRVKKQAYLRELKRAKTDIYTELENLILATKVTYNKTVKNATQDCIAIIESICHEVIGNEFDKNPNLIANKVKEEIVKLENKQFSITANPSEISNLKKEINANYVADKNMPRGTGIIKTESGSIEINWKEHLKEIIIKLTEKNA